MQSFKMPYLAQKKGVLIPREKDRRVKLSPEQIAC